MKQLSYSHQCTHCFEFAKKYTQKKNTMRRMQKRWIISSLVTTKVGIATIKATLGSLDGLQRVQSLLSAEEEETRTHLSSKLKYF